MVFGISLLKELVHRIDNHPILMVSRIDDEKPAQRVLSGMHCLHLTLAQGGNDGKKENIAYRKGHCTPYNDISDVDDG